MRSFVFAVFISFSTVPSFSKTQETVPFTGEVLEECTIVLQSPGQLSVWRGMWLKSSVGAGGQPGRVSIVATGTGFKASTKAPGSFASAPELKGSHDFSTMYRMTGATKVREQDGSVASKLNLGLSEMEILLTVVADAEAGPFPAGKYKADVTVTCE